MLERPVRHELYSSLLILFLFAFTPAFVTRKESKVRGRITIAGTPDNSVWTGPLIGFVGWDVGSAGMVDRPGHKLGIPADIFLAGHFRSHSRGCWIRAYR